MGHDFFSSVFLLLLLLDPLGNVPVFLSLLKDLPPARRRHVVLRECAVAGVVLIVFVFVGDVLLKVMHLSEPALEISGGIILFLIAMGMVFPRPPVIDTDAPPNGEPFIVPLAIPMIAGPAALATVLLASRQAEQPWLLVAAIVVAIAISTLVLLAAGWLSRMFGKSGLQAMERLMGLVLTAMSVQMLISGIRIAFNLAPATMP
ncbi:MarC family protein [Rhodocyclus gracilis]|uniref:UPF0056 membrane protein n=1 Tax=Rhodocyclus tenuis TaxID=1066 RepID=A0A6L5JUA1_RHOTE|nr:MarC family protein [Rhodocyclus gracilis]MQY50953.1 NAAT family transporter [Rhodocyclus gracilis]